LRQGLLFAGAVLSFGFAVSVGPIALMRSIDPWTSAFMIRSHWADPASDEACDGVEYQWVDFDEISSELPLAVVLSEDQRFFQHNGFDLKEIGKAIEERVEGGRLRGASTISQQVAKNLFLWPGRSVARKALEAWFTAWLERLWPKRRILEVHLNIAQFGPCVYGAEAASFRYFAKRAEELQSAEAALLASVLPSPKKLRAHDPGPYAKKRRSAVVKLMNHHRNRPIGKLLRGLR
jgi:monofunctional biosynthetic peptidoglycan transglycosylase